MCSTICSFVRVQNKLLATSAAGHRSPTLRPPTLFSRTHLPEPLSVMAAPAPVVAPALAELANADAGGDPMAATAPAEAPAPELLDYSDAGNIEEGVKCKICEKKIVFSWSALMTHMQNGHGLNLNVQLKNSKRFAFCFSLSFMQFCVNVFCFQSYFEIA